MQTTQQKGPIYQMFEKEIEEAKECRIFWEKQTKEDKADYNAPFELSAWKAIESNYKAILPKIQELEPVWMPVEERLPDMGEYHVLTAGTCFGITNYPASIFYGERKTAITHWMELPPAPNSK